MFAQMGKDLHGVDILKILLFILSKTNTPVG